MIVCKSSIEFERKYQALTHTIIMMIFPVTLKFRRLGGSSMERELKKPARYNSYGRTGDGSRYPQWRRQHSLARRKLTL
jgi:hypothetical protein